MNCDYFHGKSEAYGQMRHFSHSERKVSTLKLNVWFSIRTGNTILMADGRDVHSKSCNFQWKSFHVFGSSEGEKKRERLLRLIIQKMDSVYVLYGYLQKKRGIARCWLATLGLFSTISSCIIARDTSKDS